MHLLRSKHAEETTTGARPCSQTRYKCPTEQTGTQAGEAEATRLGRAGQGASFTPRAQGSPRTRSCSENPEDPTSGRGSQSARTCLQPRRPGSRPVNPRPYLGSVGGACTGAGAGHHEHAQQRDKENRETKKGHSQTFNSKQACKPNSKHMRKCKLRKAVSKPAVTADSHDGTLIRDF